MKFPGTIKIGEATYKVILKSENDAWHDYAEEWGHIDYGTREILLSTKPVEAKRLDSLIHEVIHGIVKHMDLGREWGDENENYVTRLSNGLSMVFKDNPEFVRLLSGD